MKAEFDDYAANYDGGDDNWLKRLLGRQMFTLSKVRWLVSRIQGYRGDCMFRMLDFGCGDGLFLQLWAERRPADLLAGYDVSAKMIDEAKLHRAFWHGKEMPDFRLFDDRWPERSFDLITVNCVLHHVFLTDRDAMLRQIRKLLKPGGRICIFEHNPRNPIVRWVVRNTAIDRNAILLEPSETVYRLNMAGFIDAELTRLMFWSSYAVMARRPYRQ